MRQLNRLRGGRGLLHARLASANESRPVVPVSTATLSAELGKLTYANTRQGSSLPQLRGEAAPASVRVATRRRPPPRGTCRGCTPSDSV